MNTFDPIIFIMGVLAGFIIVLIIAMLTQRLR